MDPKILDDMAQRLAASLPPGVEQLRTDAEKNLRAALESLLSKMNLVNREEFEVQQAVLQRTRAKLEQLELTISALENKLKDS